MHARAVIAFLLVAISCRGEPAVSSRSTAASPPPAAPPDAAARALPAFAPDAGAPQPADPLDAEIAPGITLRQLREATDAVAERARRSGQKNTVSLPACQGLESAGVVVRCTDIGTLGYGPIDRASFELPDPTEGRGLIFHYGSRADFDQALSSFQMFEREYGTFVVANPTALVIFSGAEQLSDAGKQLVRDFIGSLR